MRLNFIFLLIFQINLINSFKLECSKVVLPNSDICYCDEYQFFTDIHCENYYTVSFFENEVFVKCFKRISNMTLVVVDYTYRDLKAVDCVIEDLLNIIQKEVGLDTITKLDINHHKANADYFIFISNFDIDLNQLIYFPVLLELKIIACHVFNSFPAILEQLQKLTIIGSDLFDLCK